MCKGILGKKIGMIGVFTPAREYIPATVVKVGPCVVTQIKTKSKDGYDALQLGFGEKKASRVIKPMAGHFKKSGGEAYAFLKELPVKDPEKYSLGQKISPDEVFAVGERVVVSGKTKGRGFSGVIKRHGFARGRMTHGSHSIRIPGSIGCSAWPAKVFKGKKMPGQYGNQRKTIRNALVVDIRPEEHLLMLKGAVPGHNGGFVEIRKK